MSISIRSKIFLMIFSIILAFVMFNVVLNSTLFKLYYSKMKEQALVDNLQRVASCDYNAPDLFEQLVALEESENIRILIFDDEYNTVFCSTNDEEMLYSFARHWNYERQVEVQAPWGSYAITSSHRPGYGASGSVSYLTVYTNVIKPEPSGNQLYSVFVNTPVGAIEYGAEVANRFTIIVGFVLLVMGGAATIFIGSRFASPIVMASRAADQAAHHIFPEERLPIKSKDEIGRLSGSINDLSDQLRTKIDELSVANEQLRQELIHRQKVDDMRRMLISDISHELKTPLSIILGYCEGLQMNVNSDEREFYCSVIEDEAMRMSNLASRLLMLAELESGEVEPELSAFDLREMAADRLNKLGLLLEERGISYRLESNTDEAPVLADSERIEEVINNLLTNAKNHTPDGGEITVSITADTGTVTCRIHNTGSHIPEESLERIWDSFYKVDKARTRSYGGSGLGLKIVSSILTAHNSTFGASNTDTGVEFFFTLDQAEPMTFCDEHDIPEC
ncbi:MAG: HAMP domain-containing histidine kinase [Ruminococcaceae bacterium]|nr:HAMP domain-containing histidine kinase [Oscillospiraceae bacterium]